MALDGRLSFRNGVRVRLKKTVKRFLVYGRSVRMNYAVSTLYYRVLQISLVDRTGGKRAEVINSDECCIIEELRAVLLTERERERERLRRGGGIYRWEERGKRMWLFRKNATVVAQRSRFPVFSTE